MITNLNIICSIAIYYIEDLVVILITISPVE